MAVIIIRKTKVFDFHYSKDEKPEGDIIDL